MRKSNVTGDVMDKVYGDFLYLLKCYINNEKAPADFSFNVGEVFSLAVIHNVVPMVYSAASGTQCDVSMFKNRTLALAGMQIQKNINFSLLYKELSEAGFDVMVVKGPVCAAVYPQSDMRLSSDFDVIVKEDDYAEICGYLTSHGFDGADGVYKSESRGLYIEISTSLGEGSDRLKSIADSLFDGFWARSIISDGYRTLSHTDHMLYLIYHAFKHFVGSGFGIRQILDIMLFAEHYKDDIDFGFVADSLNKMNAIGFFNNVFYLIEKVFDRHIVSYSNENICFDVFLSDVLTAGVFGKSSEDRLHSSSMVSDAVENDGKRSMKSALLPPFSVMKKRYKILKILPFLLPFFWLGRILSYGFKCIFKRKRSSPKKSIEIADSRIDMMKKMGIVN